MTQLISAQLHQLPIAVTTSSSATLALPNTTQSAASLRVVNEGPNDAFISVAKLTTRSGKTCKPLLRSLTFPEVNELYLGYSVGGNPGAGSGGRFAEILLKSMFSLIDNGVESISEFEEIELFEEGFGADRLGDMMANLLKPESEIHIITARTPGKENEIQYIIWNVQASLANK